MCESALSCRVPTLPTGTGVGLGVTHKGWHSEKRLPQRWDRSCALKNMQDSTNEGTVWTQEQEWGVGGQEKRLE